MWSEAIRDQKWMEQLYQIINTDKSTMESSCALNFMSIAGKSTINKVQKIGNNKNQDVNFVCRNSSEGTPIKHIQ